MVQTNTPLLHCVSRQVPKKIGKTFLQVICISSIRTLCTLINYALYTVQSFGSDIHGVWLKMIENDFNVFVLIMKMCVF